MREFTLVITEKHLDKAIAAKYNDEFWNQKCILAQAAKDILPDFVSCGYTSITTSTMKYTTKNNPYPEPNQLIILVQEFDRLVIHCHEHEVTALRSKLPVSFDFEYERSGNFTIQM